MLILVTGSRTWRDRDVIATELQAAVDTTRDAPGKRTAVMHGTAQGADRIAAALARGWGWMVLDRPADWQTDGPIAGFARNGAMVAECAGYQQAGTHVTVLAFTDPCVQPCRNALCRGWTHGADHCGQLAAEAGLTGWWVRPGGVREPLQPGGPSP